MPRTTEELRRSTKTAVILALAALLFACRSGSQRPAPKAEGRPPAEIRARGNHLAGSRSAYLREHDHNPVDWYPWGSEALALAKRLDRPIFLSIGYVSCHWCHVMEKEVFEQDDVASFLNDHFVSIKVDREERPDLDAVYMDAVVALSGAGGWPMTLFLTPALRPFFAATYLPHERFVEASRAASQKYQAARSEIETHAAEVARAIAMETKATDVPAIEGDEIQGLARRMLDLFDRAYGGFRGRTKFPTPARWKFLLHAYRKWGEPALADALRKTLDAIDEGGIHDHIAGGFFRYATEPTWTIPHFEKMLYDNAQLAILYFEAAIALGEPHYRDVALDTLEFLLRDMRAPGGGFGASWDADSGGSEGAFYLWTPAELNDVAGEADGRLLAEMLGVSDAGNFEGRNVPTRRGVRAGAPSRGPSSSWEKWRSKLREARSRRPAPFFDAKAVTAWNALATCALVAGYRASGEARFLDAATETFEGLWRSNRLASGELSRASSGGQASERAVLDDDAALGLASLDVFEATGDIGYLERAVELAEQANKNFASPSGGWFLTSGADQEPLGRRMVLEDGAEPSGNANMIALLQRLAALTGREPLGEDARRALRAEAASLRTRPFDMPASLDAALFEGGPSYELVVAGSKESAGTRALIDVWKGLFPTWTVATRVDGDGPSETFAHWMPTAAGKRDAGGIALAYVCVRGSCQAPIRDPNRLRAALLHGWSR
jgi:uncharacterized protein YyaL (SSP411 family)